MTAEPPDAPTGDQRPRYVVVRGGDPRHEQLAAIAVALTPVVTVEEGQPPSPEPSGWQRAAVLEGVGARPFASPDEVDAYRRGLP